MTCVESFTLNASHTVGQRVCGLCRIIYIKCFTFCVLLKMHPLKLGCGFRDFCRNLRTFGNIPYITAHYSESYFSALVSIPYLLSILCRSFGTKRTQDSCCGAGKPQNDCFFVCLSPTLTPSPFHCVCGRGRDQGRGLEVGKDKRKLAFLPFCLFGVE